MRAKNRPGSGRYSRARIKHGGHGGGNNPQGWQWWEKMKRWWKNQGQPMT